MSDPMPRVAGIDPLPPSPRARRRHAARSLLLAAALGALAAPCIAVTYKWTDANGRVVYSDQPPTGNYKVEALAAPPPPANPNAARELATKEAEIQQRKLQRVEEEAKAAKARQDAEIKREQCVKARGQLALLRSDQNLVYRTNEKGERMLMDAAARRQERDQLEVWVRDNCAS